MELIKNIWSGYLVNAVDILIVAYVFYRIILFIKGTRALQILFGIIILALLTIIANQVVSFKTLGWLLSNFWVVGVIVIAIVFQPELRSALARLGSEPIERVFITSTELQHINKIISAVKELSEKKNGALIVIEQEVRLQNFIETGTIINGELSKEILLTIFQPGTLLHDGAAIIEGGRIISAGCILPLSENQDISKVLGTRHRAALGITEVSDAIAVVVSEETGSVSIVHSGFIEYNVNIDRLNKKLTEIFLQKKEKLFVFRDKNQAKNEI